MNKYHLSEEDKQFLAQYHVERYERPSVATDMAIFSIMENYIIGRHPYEQMLPAILSAPAVGQR